MNVITSSNLNLKLDDSSEIHRGGEGKILLLKELPTCVAKIYLPNIKPISQNQQQALQVLDNQYFVKPQDLILEPKTKIVLGFVMDYVSADFIPLAAFFNVQNCRKLKIDFDWKKNVLNKMLHAISQAHKNNIVIGDLSGLNVLVNEKGDIRFIDVDAYQTPAQPHSGLLLDEIRDYYYNGAISQTSDYFAFSVIAFNLLTYTHPYKGVHAVYKTLAERMIHLIPIFKADNQLIIPKCYEPISIDFWQKQFVELFEKPNRFSFDFTITNQTNGQIPNQIANQIPKNIPTITTTQGQLSLQTIYQTLENEYVSSVIALSNRLLIKTDKRYLIYDATNYGKTILTHEFAITVADDLFIGANQIIAKKDKQLFVYQTDNNFVALQNFNFTANSRYIQIDDILAVVENDLLKLVYLDDINQSFIRVTQASVFGQGIHIGSGGLYQTAGGKQYLFYHSGKTLSTVLVPFVIQDIYIAGNQGIISYKQQKQGNEVSLVNSFFSIQGLNFQLKDNLETFKSFAYKATSNTNQQGNGLVFEPEDNRLQVRRTEDFAVLQTLDSPILTAQTQLLNTQAGIIAVTNDAVLLLNKR